MEEKKLYRGMRELQGPAETDEFGTSFFAPLEESRFSRRRFLALLAASSAYAAMTSCSGGDRGTLRTYSRSASGVAAGRPLRYSTVFSQGTSAFPVTAVTREGRPVYVEGSEELGSPPPFRALASLLSLYDPERLRSVHDPGGERPAQESATLLGQRLSGGVGEIVIITEACCSPSRKKLLGEISAKDHRVRVALIDPLYSASRAGTEKELFGSRLEALPDLGKAGTVVSFERDILGEDDPRLALSWAMGRHKNGSRLVSVESQLTLSGAKSDLRLPVPSGMTQEAALALALQLLRSIGPPESSALREELEKRFDPAAVSVKCGLGDSLEVLARELAGPAARAAVFAGGHLGTGAHLAAWVINELTGARKGAFDESFAVPAAEVSGFGDWLGALESGAGDNSKLFIFWGVNPVHVMERLSAVGRATNFVFIGGYMNETAGICSLVLPESHIYESVGDFLPEASTLLLRQRTLEPLHGTLQGEDILMKAFGLAGASSYFDYMKERWKAEEFPAEGASFDMFFRGAMEKGFSRRDAVPAGPRKFDWEKAATIASDVRPVEAGAYSLTVHPSRTLFDGRYSENMWLNELPDPLTKATWTNPLVVSPADAADLGIEDGDVVEVSVSGKKAELPAFVLPGQGRGSFSLSLGFGRTSTVVARNLGFNAFGLLDLSSRAPFVLSPESVKKTGKRGDVPTTQEFHGMKGRDIVRSFASGREFDEFKKEKHHEEHVSLYPGIGYKGEKWAMAVDLSRCTGCSACLIACQAENNIPVVGPEQVMKGREMHWIRIDRYFEGDPARPEVVFQPMMCQQCDNAPCENVCPVNATTHSEDGLNQMVYNRCVGTRYCANNCPYKVRRFNFFEYNNDKKEPLTLLFNPEVSVRPRGVMEKCTFCVQRIEEARMASRAEKRPLGSYKITPACVSACPTRAMVFGNILDGESEISRFNSSDRAYKVIEEWGTGPQVAL